MIGNIRHYPHTSAPREVHGLRVDVVTRKRGSQAFGFMRPAQMARGQISESMRNRWSGEYGGTAPSPSPPPRAPSLGAGQAVDTASTDSMDRMT